jgi:hypothetical protein
MLLTGCLLSTLVTLSKFDEFWIPRLEPLRCSRPECGSVIRGSMFVSTAASPGPDQQIVRIVICEDCYRSVHYGDTSFTKSYKHCILAEAITPRISRAICRCKTVRHFDGSGNALALFPAPKGAHHLDVGGTGTVQCSLLKLGEMVALAKYNGLQSVVAATAKDLNLSSCPPRYHPTLPVVPRKTRPAQAKKAQLPTRLRNNGHSSDSRPRRRAASPILRPELPLQAPLPLLLKQRLMKTSPCSSGGSRPSTHSGTCTWR